MLKKIKEIEKNIVIIGLTMLFSACATQISLSASVSNEDGVNIRQEASINSAIIGKTSKNQAVSVLDVEENWLKIQIDDLVGYIYNDYIDVEDNATINGTNVNFRADASENSSILKVSDYKNRVSVLSKKDNFYEIIDDKKKYYVHKSLVTLDNANTNEESLIVKEGKVIGNNVNVRKDPTTSSEIILTLDYDDRVNVIELEGDWYKIIIDSKEYYIYKSFVVMLDESKTKIILDDDTNQIPQGLLEEKPIIYVNAITGLNLREEPSSLSKKILLMPYKAPCSVLEKVDDWYKIQTQSGHIGYASAEFLTYDKEALFFIPNEALRKQVVHLAKQYYGTKYVYGGNSLTEGIDCSGFTQQIFSKFDIELTRTANSQSLEGIEITKPELLPGDLVFFATMGGNTISHVAMYIGDNKIIHATSPTNAIGVDISDLSEEYYMNTYRCSRRVIPDNEISE